VGITQETTRRGIRVENSAIESVDEDGVVDSLKKSASPTFRREQSQLSSTCLDQVESG